MLERDGYPPGVPCWVDTDQPDPEAAVAFYGQLFGWEFVDIMPAGSPGRYFVARLQGRDVAGVGSQPDAAPPTPVWNTYIWVDSADDATQNVKEAGGNVLVEPFDVLDAGRMAVVADTSGAVFSLWEANAHKGAQLVNEPGTWVWSDLNTRDPEGCEAFYGAVFGWEADAVETASGKSWLWRRPGYGQFLEVNDPDLRRRLEEFEAPKGFEDCVGGMNPMTADHFPENVPAHWTVMFAVDDPDAIAGRAAELGGTVLTEPFDAGPLRVAVIRDPQGSVFSVGRYDPS